MSDKDKALVEKISKMPDSVKDKFLTMAEGAAIALESVKENNDKQDH